MPKQILIFVLFLIQLAWGQHKLDDFIGQALQNAPTLKEYRNQQVINRIQQKINGAENSAFHLSLTGDYLFTPYFNNHGQVLSTNPSDQAYGYDIALFDGGLYSAQFNVERNIFNGRLLRVLDQQIRIQDENAAFRINLEQHNLRKQVTEQYLVTWQSLLQSQLCREVVDNLDKQLRLTGELVEKGFATPQDYLLLKIESKNQTVHLNDSQQAYRGNLYQLYAQCGIADTALVEIQPAALTLAVSPAQSGFLRQYALDSLSTVNQQAVYETKYQPQLGLFLNTGVNAVELKNIQHRFGMSAGLSLAVPLYDGRQKSLTRQQNLLLQNSITEYRRYSEKNIALQRSTLGAGIRALQSNLALLQGQIDDYKQVLLFSEKQLQQGNVSMIEHLTLLRNFIELRKSKIETEINCQMEINNFNYWNW